MDHWLLILSSPEWRAQLTISGRFPQADELLAQFDSLAARWRSRRLRSDVKALDEKANEIFVAIELLKDIGPTDALHYEPPLFATRKVFDFLVVRGSGERTWIEVKSVHPDISEFESPQSRTDQKQIRAGWSFVRRIVEVEAKASLLTEQETAPTAIMLCGDGSSFQAQQLANFAHYYSNGSWLTQDASSIDLAAFIAAKRYSFRHTLSGIYHLERRRFSAHAQLSKNLKNV